MVLSTADPVIGGGLPVAHHYVALWGSAAAVLPTTAVLLS